MKIFGPNTERLSDEYRGAVVCLGFFDGVHKGHAQLIDKAIGLSRETGKKAMVYTFNISPKNFGDNIRVLEITPLNLKAQILSTFNIDALFIDRFDEEMKSLTGQKFVEKVIVEKLGASHVIVGFNYRFGKNAMCSNEELKTLCAPLGIGVTAMPPCYANGSPISSTLIRSAITQGEMQKVRSLLGRPFFIVSRVIRGQQIGSVLDVKTINQEFIQNTIMPKKGVYISRSTVDGVRYMSMTNVGTRPTVNKGEDIRVETHILGFNSDVYEKNVKVEFLERIRDEMRFSGLEELKLQLLRDTQETYDYFKKNPNEA